MSRSLGFVIWVCALQLGGCVFLDDFDKYKASGDGGVSSEAGKGGGESGTGGGNAGQAGDQGQAGDGAGESGTGGGGAAGTSAGTGGGTDFDCHDFNACGGDVVGKWKISSSCLQIPATPLDGCPTASITATRSAITGSIEFGDDGTYTLAFKTTETVKTFVPKDCLVDGATCADIDPDMPENVDDTGTACVEEQEVSDDSSENGTYTIEGTVVTMTSDASPPEVSTLDVCVSGKNLAAHQGSGDGDISLVATKQ